MLALLNCMIVPFMGLVPIYVQGTFDGGTGAVGVVASAQGIGAIIGGIVTSILAQRFARSSMVKWIVIVTVGLLVGYALAPTIPWTIAIVFVLGGAWSSLFITLSAVIQRDAPPASRGRVMSLMQATFGITYGVGLLFVGAIGDTIDLRVGFIVGAVIALAGFYGITVRARNWRAAIDGTETLVQAELATC